MIFLPTRIKRAAGKEAERNDLYAKEADVSRRAEETERYGGGYGRKAVGNICHIIGIDCGGAYIKETM